MRWKKLKPWALWLAELPLTFLVYYFAILGFDRFLELHPLHPKVEEWLFWVALVVIPVAFIALVIYNAIQATRAFLEGKREAEERCKSKL